MTAAVLDAVFDAAVVFLALYIVVVGAGRLAMMSWRTHRRGWQAIYLVLVIAGLLFLKAMAEGDQGQSSFASLLLLGATAAWFHESRDRWKKCAPDYMSINCPHLAADELLPAQCPITKARDAER